MGLNREALEVADGFVYTTGRAVLHGDYDRFRPCFWLPYQIEINNDRQLIETEQDMRHMFDQVRELYKKNEVEDLIRTVIEASFLERDAIGLTFVSKLITREPDKIKPFPIFSVLRRHEGVWTIRSSLYAFVDDAPAMSKAYSPDPIHCDPSKTKN